MSNGVKRSKPFVRPASPLDIFPLAKTMRKEDQEECLHFSNSSPFIALVDSYALSSDCWTVEWDGRVVAMFGCGGQVGHCGHPWMLASDDLVKIKKSFLREAKDYLQLMEDKYVYLTNWAWAKNEVHTNWLKWMGMTFDAPAPLREGGEPFIRFHKGNHVYRPNGNAGDHRRQCCELHCPTE